MKLRVKEKQENKLNTKKIKIGVLGGSFDPAHKGHLAISKEAKKRFQLQNIIWAITKKNPFKAESETSVLKRIKECKRIIGSNSFIKVKFYENLIKSNKTIDLINHLKKNKNIEIYFLMGNLKKQLIKTGVQNILIQKSLLKLLKMLMKQ